MQKTLVFLSLLISIQLADAQPFELMQPASHQYLLDNPAAMGLDNQHHLLLGASQQWFNVEGSPTTAFLASSHPLLYNALGIGGTLVHDRFGLVQNTRLGMHAAVHFSPQDSPHRFSLGAGARFQFMNFLEPNVEDVIAAGGIKKSNINLSLGANYQVRWKESSFFNFYVLLPQFPVDVELVGAQQSRDSSLSYRLGDHLVLQGNWRIDLASGMALTPSVRYQAQPSGDYWEKTQLIDLAMGMSFMNEKFRVRVGARIGENAGIVYGGLGIGLNEGRMQANVFYKPDNLFGGSGYFDANLTLGTGTPPPVKLDLSSAGLTERLAAQSLQGAFQVQSFPDPITNQTYLLYSFSDRVDAYIDFLANEDYLIQTPLQKLFTEMDGLSNELENKKIKIVRLNLVANVKNQLSQPSRITFRGAPFNLSYLESGTSVMARDIERGHVFTEGELAAAKLHFLNERMKRRINALENVESRMEVVRDPSITDNRLIQIGLLVEEK